MRTLLFTCLLPLLAVSADRPNVILMMADDLGYADLSCYGGSHIRTPVLDGIAKEGIRMTDYYSGNTVCTPSRMALMTGAYPPRVGWPGGVMGYRIKHANGMSGDALTMAEVFKSAGYATGISGKWHMGMQDAMRPEAQGFDSCYYISMSNNQTKKVYRDGEIIINPFDNRLLSEMFTKEAIRFIDKHKEKPFFLYMPWTAPHFPVQAHPDWKGKSPYKEYGDVVEELDSRVGEVLQTLKKHGLDENTIVLFTSDNGPQNAKRPTGRREPFRGMKWSPMEGGNRVVCVMKGPGIPAGKVHSGLTGAIDLLPTLAEAAGIQNYSKGSPKLDGVSVWKSLTRAEEHPRSDFIFWDGWATPNAIRVGDYKLYVHPFKDLAGSEQAPVLYNVSTDKPEVKDLATQHPEKVAELKALLITRLEEISKNSLKLGGIPDPDHKEPEKATWLE